jgi:fermentation-respiration switch protein FrsA (DUF1100 family)
MSAFWQKPARFAVRHWPVSGFLLLLLTMAMTPHLLERFFVYYPSRALVGNPGDIGLEYRDLFLITNDDVRLHGWFVPSAGSRVTLLIFHGNAGNVSHRLEWIRLLHGLSCHVLIIDYRGYGKSEGSPFERGLYLDARAAYRWWVQQQSGPGQKLVVMGESLGGCVAVDLAAEVNPAGLILQSTFTSARDMARTLFPLGLLHPLTGIRFDSVSKIGGVRCPKLVIHGTRDEIVPFGLGRKLYEAAPPPKIFYEVADAGHNDLVWAAGTEYSKRLHDFLSRVGQT